MKQFTYLLALAALTTLPFAMTSCDDDPWHESYDPWHEPYDPDNGDNTLYDMAATLCGEWTGPMELHEDGATYNFTASMVFYQNGQNGSSLRGNGIETDYATLDNGDVDTQTLTFSWYIDQQTGDIYITYTNSGTRYALDYSATQRGFYLSSNEFYGYMLGVTEPSDYIAFDFTRAGNYAKASGFGRTATTPPLFGTQSENVTIDTTQPQLLPKR